MDVTLADPFWAPRQAQLRDHTLAVILDRLERQGVVENFRRLAGRSDARREAMHFSDSDLYKWVEAAVLAGRLDLAEESVELIEAVQRPDGYVHTYYDTDAGFPRWTDLDLGHEQYCAGHLIEAAIAHHEVTGDDRLLTVATRCADDLLATFGPGRDERTDGHPEIELALARFAATTGDPRYLDHARWTVEARLAQAGSDVATYRLGGHAVRSLYFASGIAEVALATGDDTYVATATRALDDLLRLHSYPTGAVGGRWMGEAVGRPYELPDATAYAETCAAVAAVQFCDRMWRLTGDPRALDQIELLLYNAVPCGIGADGESWFYSQPQAVDAVEAETNPWVAMLDYGDLMSLAWYPPRRHQWFVVPCCPPNLARMFATVDRYVASTDAGGDLLVRIPAAARIEGDGWDVTVDSAYPDDGRVAVDAATAPEGATVRVHRPAWAGGAGPVPLAADGRADLPVDWAWWETDGRVEQARHTAFVRRGPVVHCVEGVDAPDLDLRDLVVDPAAPPTDAFTSVDRVDGAPLHRPYVPAAPGEPVTVRTTPYAEWANRGTTTMRVRFPTAG